MYSVTSTDPKVLPGFSHQDKPGWHFVDDLKDELDKQAARVSAITAGLSGSASEAKCGK